MGDGVGVRPPGRTGRRDWPVAGDPGKFVSYTHMPREKQGAAAPGQEKEMPLPRTASLRQLTGNIISAIIKSIPQKK